MVPGDRIEDSDEDIFGFSSTNDHSDKTEREPSPFNKKFVLCSLYILLGMALIAMCFNLMQEKVVRGVRSLGKRLASKNKVQVQVDEQG